MNGEDRIKGGDDMYQVIEPRASRWLVGLLVALVTVGAVLDTRFGTNRPWLPRKRGSEVPAS